MKKLIILFVTVALPQVLVLAQANETTKNDTDTNTCGQFNSPCKKSPYRSFDGSCNNLENPRWGTPGSAYVRLISTNSYTDGIHEWPQSSTNKSLMNARRISFSVSPDVRVYDPVWNVVTLQWGQFISHDMSLNDLGNPVPKCCTSGLPIPPKPNRRCMAIPIPDDDPFFAPEGDTCFDFVRTVSNEDKKCNLPGKTQEPISAVTSFIDLSTVYGSSEMTAKQLRTHTNGKLKSDVRNGQHWLPENPNAATTCSNKSPLEPCYIAGDTRVNQNPHLAVIQTMMMRQHNRMAKKLHAINPHWDDEKLYQEARRILIGIAQHITYSALIPIYVGVQNVIKKGLNPEVFGYVNDYNKKINPQIINEHAAAAFRNPHSEVVGFLRRFGEARQNYTGLRLSDWINRPSVIEEDMSGLARGLSFQPQYVADRFFDSEITVHFDKKKGKTFGTDLRSIDIQRGRDHGLPPYIDVLVWCGNPKPNSFDDLTKYMSPGYVRLLKQTYQTLEDVELTVAGNLETHAPGALTGPTYACIISEQFHRSRVGDRYFYANNEEGAFTLSQLRAIRNASMSRLLCDNVPGVKTMQPDAFFRVSFLNPLIPCHKLPQVNLKYWKQKSEKLCTSPT